VEVYEVYKEASQRRGILLPSEVEPMKRYMESLFSHKLLFLLPAVIIPIIVVGGGLAMGGSYQVEARIWVDNQPFLVASDVGIGQMANELEAQAMQEWLSTKAFGLEILDRAGLTPAVENAEWPERGGVAAWPVLGPILKGLGIIGPMSVEGARSGALDYIQRTLSVDARGNNLVIVSYSGDDSVLGQVLVQALISAYTERAAESLAQKSAVAMALYEDQLQVLGGKLSDSAQALGTFLETHPVGFLNEPRPPDEELELTQLQDQYSFDRIMYEATLDRLEQARAAAKAGESLTEVGFQVIDPPEAPQSSTMTRRTTAMMAIGGFGGGLGLGFVLIALVASADKSVSSSEDLALITNSPVLAVVPHTDLKGKKPRERKGEGQRTLLSDIAKRAASSDQ